MSNLPPKLYPPTGFVLANLLCKTTNPPVLFLLKCFQQQSTKILSFMLYRYAYALAYSIIHNSMAAFKTIDMYMYKGIAIMYVLHYKRLSRYKAILISSIKISPQ